MDNSWKTPAWSWDRNAEDEKKGKIALFRCRPGKAFAVQVSQDRGCLKPSFIKTTRVLETQVDWEGWLKDVPQPDSITADGSLSFIVCPRAPDKGVGGKALRNPLNLTHVPLPDAETFTRLIETFHVHQATQTIMNRGWAIILRSEDRSGTDRKIYYNLRTTNSLDHDTALTITHIPAKRLTYAISLGYTDVQVNTVLGRLEFAEHAALEPFTLINAFIQIEKRYRFEQVELHVDDITRRIKNFSSEIAAAASSKSKSKISRPILEDDPQNLVGKAGEMRLLTNGLVSWAREMERFKEKVAREFPSCVGKDEKFPLLDAGEYLDRTVDEYGAMVRRCEGMLEQVSMTFQMETSSIARQEVNKMKALAILTMLFLPATFVATFMSMGLFEWHPKDGERVLSNYWWIYFLVAGVLTLGVFLVYFWSRLRDAWPSFRGRKSEDHMV
ncbi:hypothetical protein B0T16DRAFT_408321 [Cercophora newfieldiana]|uniref:Uncharacterized protein n=1 Tax=Cercophora newfieldiana TaxID=92897 RepID=A0AA39YBL0_9PEZI|nr:hypothetical protein B0T16DRAFT_408321 [Cercophora newfieldiana]